MENNKLAAEKEAKPSPSWPLWKKIALGAVMLIIVIALAVGLGVGLTRDNGSDDNDGNNDQGNEGDTPSPGPDTPDTPDRTETWYPEVNASWQIVLREPIAINGDTLSPDVDIYDLDLFDNDVETFQAVQDAGKRVICYFSAGSYEEWRDDAGEFDEDDLGLGLDGWLGERWLRLSSPNVRDIMSRRIQLARDKGCDAVDPDNVDGYQNENGLRLTRADSIDFIGFLSDEAHARNMSIGLKNAGTIIPDVLDQVDFSVNEQCVQYSECETFAAFIDNDKPVFHIEYPDGAPDDVGTSVANTICSRTGDAVGSRQFSTVMKKMNLDGWVEYCDGSTFRTQLDT